VETDEQARYLCTCRCEIGQGYGFARPMPASDFDKWLKEYTDKPRASAQQSDQLPMQA
jgi:EAL domain-containing protein (putative c-di-GMP-specific phosphodiesterase class I)